MATRRQELHCHECGRYVQFDVDLSIDGNHVLSCPVCGHEHCRVVRNGEITDIRWDSRNGPTVYIPSAATSSTAVSTWDSYLSSSSATTDAGSNILYQSWLDRTGT